MKAASLNEIRKQLVNLDATALSELCLTLVRFKKDNKELLTYLLFEAQDEQAYIDCIKTEVDELFAEVPKANVYFVKKSIRKILRIISKHIRYSGLPITELEVRIHFCLRMKEANIPLHAGTVLFNLYQQQLKKIDVVLSRLPEDLRFDYERDLQVITKQ